MKLETGMCNFKTSLLYSESTC